MISRFIGVLLAAIAFAAILEAPDKLDI